MMYLPRQGRSVAKSVHLPSVLGGHLSEMRNIDDHHRRYNAAAFKKSKISIDSLEKPEKVL